MSRIIGIVSATLATASLLLAGCATSPFHVPMADPGGCETTQGHAISESACGTMLGGVIPIGMSDRYERGYNGLLQQAPGKCISDIKMMEELKYIFVGWRFCTYFLAMSHPKKGPEPSIAR